MKFIVIHTGIGDIINRASAIAQLAAKELVIIPLVDMTGKGFHPQKKKNIEAFLDGLNVRLLDVQPNTDIFAMIENLSGIGTGWFSFRGCTGKDFHIENHDKYAYEQLGCDWDNRQKYCPIKENVKKVKQLPIPEEPYVFIPEGGSTGQFRIDRQYVTKGLKEIIPPQDSFMPEWADIIYNATEIQAHDCGWFALIDKLPTKGRLVFHIDIRNESDYVYELFSKWEIIGNAKNVTFK